ncbi:DUF6804 family protein [Ferruginibacter albus]|uniref:DUF6804 family protein n=1 Tax=Ferruginibacter albus TaxID=2875540 RepID=UPI001CC7DCF0|nr:DUF6804 family protein [Ferruginibacter albus]UAY50658.1 hypothetical protein K9M53_08630 [Ferruginibacter albus]
MKFLRIIVKLIIVILLLLSLSNQYYKFYDSMRIIVCIGFFYLVFAAIKNDQPIGSVLSLGCAILFNPVAPIVFSYKVWSWINTLIAISVAIWFISDLINYFRNREMHLD